MQGRLEGDAHEAIWSNPEKIPDRIIDHFTGLGCTDIAVLGLSLSGLVTPDGSLKKSDRLDEILRKHGRSPSKFRNLPLRESLLARLPQARVAVVNDAAAAGMAGAIEGATPVLVMALGTWPAISIAERGDSKVHIRLAQKFMRATVQTPRGEKKISSALSNKAMARLGGPEKARRVGNAIAAVLNMYAECFGGAYPRTVRLLGGNSLLGGLHPNWKSWLDPTALERLKDTDVHLPESYEAQSLLHLRGAAACAELPVKLSAMVHCRRRRRKKGDRQVV